MQQTPQPHLNREETSGEPPRRPRNIYRNSLSALVPVTLGLIALIIAWAAGKDVVNAISHPAARSWLGVGHSCLRTAVMVAFAAFTVNRDAPVRRARNPMGYAACFVAVGTIISLQPPAASVPSLAILAGDLVAFAFYGWVLASVLTLRSCFAVLPEARDLVTSGPYRFMRHPVYFGELGALAGLVIAAPSIFNSALFGAFVLAQWVRMGFEERALTAAFPEYRGYAEVTPRLLPASPRRRRRAMGVQSSVARSWT